VKYTVTQRSSCRLCGSSQLTPVVEFDSIPFFDEVVTRESKGSEFSYPMKLYFCRDCASVQSQHDVNLIEYYHSYQYVASHSPFIRTYMQALVEHCRHHFDLRAGDRVIDVGAADGYLLSLFKDGGATTLGFEAAENLCQLAEANGIDVVNALFTMESLNLIPADFQQTQLLVLLHTFDHLFDPAPFLDVVRQILDPVRGVLLLEVHDLRDIYVKRETALFGHEHATYLHFGSMQRFLERHGFRLVDFNFLPKEMCRGSSMLVAATPAGSEVEAVPNLASFADPRLDDLQTFEAFQASVSRSFAHLREYIDAGRAGGHRFAGYGGWGRGVTTLAMARLSADHLEFVVDGNPSLRGCFTPVTGFPIEGPDAVSRDTVDEVIVFNYAYIDEIRQTLADFIADGGKVVSVIDLLTDTAVSS
jgi:C-methyltransferase C-terminal domain/Putative zinc binding domain/Methyltransferase domain